MRLFLSCIIHSADDFVESDLQVRYKASGNAKSGRRDSKQSAFRKNWKLLQRMFEL